MSKLREMVKRIIKEETGSIRNFESEKVAVAEHLKHEYPNAIIKYKKMPSSLTDGRWRTFRPRWGGSNIPSIEYIAKWEGPSGARPTMLFCLNEKNYKK